MNSAIRKSLGLLIFPEFQLLDAAGPIAAFEIAGRFGAGGYGLNIISAAGGDVFSSSGVPLRSAGFDDDAIFDTLIVAGGDGTRRAAADKLVTAFVRRAAGTARRVASVCSGTFILAEAGVLDGRRATTHWSRSAQFARLYPRIRLEPDRIFTRDGAIWTSAGITAGIDLCLALIAEDLGEPIARKTAQQLVVYRQRPGGQSQFSALLDLERPGGRFSPLLSWARERLAENLSVERLAEQAAMSPRNFARRFHAEIGMTPARAVERLRVEVARDWVESTSEPVDAIAARAGFGDPERMRCAFLRAFGQPPQGLRRAARTEPGEMTAFGSSDESLERR
jgi:transcriptional regulator GlxA family with amidase domain